MAAGGVKQQGRAGAQGLVDIASSGADAARGYGSSANEVARLAVDRRGSTGGRVETGCQAAGG